MQKLSLLMREIFVGRVSLSKAYCLLGPEPASYCWLNVFHFGWKKKIRVMVVVRRSPVLQVINLLKIEFVDSGFVFYVE